MVFRALFLLAGVGSGAFIGGFKVFLEAGWGLGWALDRRFWY